MCEYIYRLRRRAIRKIACFILSFERCPKECLKDYRALVLEAVARILLVTILIASLLGIFLLFS